jgi:hypothetical protein
MDRDTKKDIELLLLLISEINISKYNQSEFREIVETIHWQIFIGEKDEE